MKPVPFQDVTQCPRRELTANDSSLNRDCYLKIPILCMEMGWGMVSIEHRYHYSQESADFRHGVFYANFVKGATA